jgi:UDP-N-acetylmuramate dehydrogenase
LAESWLRSIPGIREGEPLARHSWYGIGGTAEFFLELESEVPLARLLPRLAADATPVFPLGLGTNTLFSGPLLAGLTIRMANENIQIDGETVAVSAGFPMPRLAAETAKAGRAGLEFGAGVPGTVGGSVFGNAGAFGTEVKDCLIAVEAIDPAGRVHQLSAADCQFAYRDSAFKSGPARSWVITRATFAVQPGDPTAIRERIKQVQKHRRDTQPIDKRSLGSTFKNPPGDSAGRLIDAAGLKGRRIGGAQVSPKHANFIVNVGGATADDVLALVAEMRDGVRQRFGIELEPEIRIVGQ